MAAQVGGRLRWKPDGLCRPWPCSPNHPACGHSTRMLCLRMRSRGYCTTKLVVDVLVSAPFVAVLVTWYEPFLAATLMS